MTGQTFLYYNKAVGKRQENSMLYPLRGGTFWGEKRPME